LSEAIPVPIKAVKANLPQRTRRVAEENLKEV
jgi:hypothetical protein